MENANNEETTISPQKTRRDLQHSGDPSSPSIEQSFAPHKRSAVSLEKESSNVGTSPQNNAVTPVKGYNNDMGESQFEDEHNDAPNDRSSPRNAALSPLSPQSSVATVSPNGGDGNGDGGGGGGNNSVLEENENDTAAAAQEKQDEAFVQKFWTAYDEILILSLFTQVGILFRLAAAYGFRYFDSVFHSDSALFTNLPLNCLSCFLMGLLCSGESSMEIILTRFTPPRLQQDLHREATQYQEDEITSYQNHYYTRSSKDEEIIDNGEEIVELGTNRLKRRGWRRRIKRNKNESRNIKNRISNLIRRKHQQQAQSPEIFDELREVQLLAWERRIRASVCLLLFPVKKEDVDIVENYFDDGYQKETSPDLTERLDGEEKVEDSNDVTSSRATYTIDEHCATLSSNGQMSIGGFDDLIFEEETDDCQRTSGTKWKALSPSKTPSRSGSPQKLSTEHTSMETTSTERKANEIGRKQPSVNEDPLELAPNENTGICPEQGRMYARGNVHISSRQYGQVEGGNIVDYGTQDNPDLDQIISNMATGMSNKISFMGRVNLANGWDVGCSPQEKSEDLTLGLRDGLCGALSSFSSWISSMVNLFRAGQIGQAFVGLTIGIQLPIVAYRFGQYVSVYIFVWRCRREKRQDEKRGYGIQLHTSDEEISTNFIRSSDSLDRASFDSVNDSLPTNSQHLSRTKGLRTVHDEESDVPSIRAIFTALFITCLVAQLTSLTFFKKPEDRLLALSLLFSPLGVLARWRMMKFNSWRPSFPLGTFACNVTACALSGTLGTLIAGNPGPRERIALVSIIAGFGGTLSSVARFIVEILSLLDPILFRFDGFYYAIASVGTGILVSFLFAASVDWADSV